MPRPLKFPTKVLIGFDDERLKAIDAWRRKQEDIPSRSDAIRRLVDQALVDTQDERLVAHALQLPPAHELAGDRKPDWAQIKADFEAGTVSTREIARREGVSH